MQNLYSNSAAAAAKVHLPSPYANTAIDHEVNRLNIIDDMKLDKEVVFAQVHLSPSPYFEAFQEEIDLQKWTTNNHHTAGLSLIEQDGQLTLANIIKSTPVARIDKWRSRCHGAILLEVEGQPVHSIKDLESILKNLKAREFERCQIVLAHPEIKTSLTSQGISQLHIDQLNPRYILN